MINNEGVGGVEPQHDHRSLLSWALDPAAEKLRNGMYLPLVMGIESADRRE
jgi:hypothetical protein